MGIRNASRIDPYIRTSTPRCRDIPFRRQNSWATERGKHDYLLGAIPVIIRILGTGLSGSPEYGVGGASSLAKFNV